MYRRLQHLPVRKPCRLLRRLTRRCGSRSSTEIAKTTCSASQPWVGVHRKRRRSAAPAAPVASTAPAAVTKGANGNQMRSTSAFDIPLSAAIPTAGEPSADHDPQPPVAEPCERDRDGRSEDHREDREVGEQVERVHGRLDAIPAKYCSRVAASPSNQKKPDSHMTSSTRTPPSLPPPAGATCRRWRVTTSGITPMSTSPYEKQAATPKTRPPANASASPADRADVVREHDQHHRHRADAGEQRVGAGR